MSENAKNPPGWAEWLLEHLLPEIAREGIVGDLREEYVESLLPRYGRAVATLWYLRHVLSFLPCALRESRTMGRVLIFISGFTMTCMFWLASMEMALRHPGYGTRMALDICFALSCLATAILRMLPSPRTRSEMWLGGAGLIAVIFGANAFVENAHAAHFEGFVFVISLLLIAQGMLALLTLGRSGKNNLNQAAK